MKLPKSIRITDKRYLPSLGERVYEHLAHIYKGRVTCIRKRGNAWTVYFR